MSDDKVVALHGGPVASEEERALVEHLAAKVHAFVECHGHVPDCAVLTLWGRDDDKGEMTWAAGWFSPNPARGKLESYGTAMGILMKAIGT